MCLARMSGEEMVVSWRGAAVAIRREGVIGEGVIVPILGGKVTSESPSIRGSLTEPESLEAVA